MSKEVGIGEFPKAGQVIRHSIGRPRYVLEIRVVTMVSAMKATDAKEVCCWISGGDGSLDRAGDSRSVVIED